ncbi:MAG TPA: hypothetical protein PKD90_11645 [Phnomibacter sp.]|nr:hypothetical protein [Phnomibacter sp.]
MKKGISALLLLLLVTGCVWATGSGSAMDEYTGKYIFVRDGAGSEAVIEVQGGSLQVQSRHGKATLQAIEADVFTMVEYEGTLEFKRNAAGKVIGVRIKLGNLDIEAVKDNYAFYWYRQNMLFKRCINDGQPNYE